MFVVKVDENKYKFNERYKDKYTDKWRNASVTLDRDTPQSRKKAKAMIDKKINSQKKVVKNINLEELVEQWKNNHYKGLKDTSKRSYGSALKVIQKNIKSDIKAKNIDAKFIQAFFDSEEISKYSNNYILIMKIVLKMIFDYAENLEYIENNPLNKVKVTMRKDTQSKIEIINKKFLEKSEVKIFLDAFTKRQYRFKLITEFLILTGLRFGELQALRNSDINKNILSVQRTFQATSNARSPEFTSPKTSNSYRKIEISKRCIEIIKEINFENEILKLDELFSNEGIIFCSKYGGVISNNNYNQLLKRVMAKTDIDKNITAHSLRHTHVSLLAEQNIPVKTIVERVGHADERMTISVYTHVTKNMKSDLVDKLNNLSF